MSSFVESLPFTDLPTFNPNAKSDEVIVQVVEKKVVVEKVKVVKEKAAPVKRAIVVPPQPAPPNLTREALNELVTALGTLSTKPANVEVSVNPTPYNIAPASVQVTPQITVQESPTPRKWRVEVTKRDDSPEKRIKELTIEAVD